MHNVHFRVARRAGGVIPIMTKLYNTENLKYYRRELRKSPTDYEALMWKNLRKRRLYGVRFLRQYSIGKYILDFYCPGSRLGIEIDGSHHLLPEISDYDRVRTVHIESFYIKIIRFTNEEVFLDIDKVLNRIAEEL